VAHPDPPFFFTYYYPLLPGLIVAAFFCSPGEWLTSWPPLFVRVASLWSAPHWPWHEAVMPPLTFSLSVPANAGAAVATNIMAANKAAVINKLMRLITLYPFLTTSTRRFMSQAVLGRM